MILCCKKQIARCLAASLAQQAVLFLYKDEGRKLMKEKLLYGWGISKLVDFVKCGYKQSRYTNMFEDIG